MKPAKGAIRRNSLGIEFVFVPPGSFQMGTNETYPNPDENPLHKVTIRDGFFMGKTEVTQGQWRAVMNENPSHFQGDKNQLGNDDNLPIEKVSWEDAKEFIKKLNAKNDGFEYRLPSEAEWEYAARAGTTNDYPGQLIDIAWYANNSGRNYLNAQEISQNDDKNYFKRVRTENKGQPHPVATKSPNAFGLFDMHGNVWEWCEDVYKYEGYKNVPTDGSPNLTEGAGGSKIRVLRGGSWYDSEETFRLGNRSKGIGTYDRIGFRLAMRLR
ncbi:MAG: formylglycine-generating enzyme family protein [Pyrinomonadaceae bacterium]|nr:formylglycine-generating enzyme family protein [Pyrinomonadaceae bacterium]